MPRGVRGARRTGRTARGQCPQSAAAPPRWPNPASRIPDSSLVQTASAAASSSRATGSARSTAVSWQCADIAAARTALGWAGDRNAPWTTPSPHCGSRRPRQERPDDRIGGARVLRRPDRADATAPGQRHLGREGLRAAAGPGGCGPRTRPRPAVQRRAHRLRRSGPRPAATGRTASIRAPLGRTASIRATPAPHRRAIPHDTSRADVRPPRRRPRRLARPRRLRTTALRRGAQYRRRTRHRPRPGVRRRRRRTPGGRCTGAGIRGHGLRTPSGPGAAVSQLEASTACTVLPPPGPPRTAKCCAR